MPETEELDPTRAPEAEEAGSGGESDPGLVESLIAERDRLEAEKADFQDRFLRGQAEFQNFRRRVEKERLELSEYAAMEAVRSILPILDDFERALEIETTDAEYAKGMGMIYQRLFDSLKKLGLAPLEAKGLAFDPHTQHAVDMVETTEAEDQTVLEEFQRGYNFKGQLLRAAMVKVAVKPKS